MSAPNTRRMVRKWAMSCKRSILPPRAMADHQTMDPQNTPATTAVASPARASACPRPKPAKMAAKPTSVMGLVSVSTNTEAKAPA